MISIIIPTCNEEKDVSRLIDCLLNSSVDKEIIVTDDASTDKTLLVLEKYENKIKVLANQPRHKSIAANRNEGAKSANIDSEFLVFMDATTFLKNPDDFFKKALSIFNNDKNLVAITGRLMVLKEFETFGDKVMHFLFNLIIMIKNNYLGMTEASGKFEMIRRAVFEKVNGFNEDLITREDADMFGRLAKIGKTRYMKELEIFYTGRRQHILGWPKLLFIWMLETFWVSVFGKARTKVWPVTR
ncbi:MAG: glycosyltransferase [Candidatus Paceibacterota bacterium]|jgi:glycosyltransferase involved in cell wall biosynthesis